MFRDTTPVYEFRGPWGVPIQFGASLILLPLLMIDFGAAPRSVFYDAMFVAILIGSILLHELGHAWGALIQGVPVRRIMLYGGGGFCEQSRSASRFEQELIVAMGPIVNLVLWAVAGLIAPHVADPETAWLIATVAWINGFLAVVNLLPVLPLDGGRLFELLLHRVLPADTAIRISGAVGLVFALLWFPAILTSYATIGVILFFIPSIPMHWRMLRTAQA